MNERQKQRVLFICNSNVGRSQMAEALLRSMYGDRYEVFSAGVVPGEISPYTVRVMEEMGADMSGQRSKSIDEFRDVEMDIVVTVCDAAQETCPFFPAKQVIHHSFAGAVMTDNEAESMDNFRRVRDDIRTWLMEQFNSD